VSISEETSDDQNSSDAAPVDASAKKRPRSPFRVSRLMLKELRETLRDRRTLITLILMPLLVYPALSLVFKTFLLNNLEGLTAADPVALQIVFAGDGSDQEVQQLKARFVQFADAALMADRVPAVKSSIGSKDNTDGKEDLVEGPADNPFPGLKGFREHFWSPIPKDSEFPLEAYIEPAADSGEFPAADVGVYFSRVRRAGEAGTNLPIFEAKIVHSNNGFSRTAAAYLRYCFRKANDFEMRFRLQQLGLPANATWTVVEDELGESSSSGLASLAGLIPLVLVLMTITGAVYPAIDLTAGERERGTLETLMAAPISRFWILFSKFVAVVTVAMLTAVLNLIGMFATIWAFQLDKQLGIEIFNLSTMLQILGLLILFAGFFSAVLLVVTSFAKSFKEAQVYLIPVILLSLGPGLMAMAPEMK